MRRSIALVSLIALAGCASEPEVPLCEAEAASECRVNQQGCRLEGDVPTCTPCTVGRHADAAGACVAIPGTAMTHAFPDITTAPGEEIAGVCRSWTLGNETEIWVTGVELEQDEASHHSNWTFVPEGYYDGPDGVWPCADRDYHQLNAAVAGGVIYAQSTQAAREVQLFPEGAAVRIPAHSRIISDVHLLNTTPAAVTGNATMSLYTLPRDQVTTPLAPFHIEYHALDIPARSRSRFEAEVPLREQFESATLEPFEIRLAYSLPHTHALGARVYLQAVGGPRDGEMLLDVGSYNGEARGLAYSPPIDLTGITGFRFGCEFENPRAERVGYGIGDQEMCEMLGFIDSVAAFEATVNETTSMTMDGDITVFHGTTENFIIPWADRFTEWAPEALRTAPLILRPYRRDDLDRLASLVTDPRVMSGVGGALRSDEVLGLLERYVSAAERDVDPRILAARAVERAEDRVYVGHGRIVTCEHEEGPEIGYLVHPDHQGRGVATEIARALVAIAGAELDAERVYATVHVDHAASLRVLEKAGFAHLRTCHDDDGDLALLVARAPRRRRS